MHFINTLSEGQQIKEIYLVKKVSQAQTKAGKPYLNVILQDKTGTIDCKIWDPSSPGIEEFDALDYISICGDVSVYNGSYQMSIRQARKASEGEYTPADYLPCSESDPEEMYTELLRLIHSVNLWSSSGGHSHGWLWPHLQQTLRHDLVPNLCLEPSS